MPLLMTGYNDNCEEITYRLVLLSADKVWVVEKDAFNTVALPRLSIPRGSRQAREIQRTIYTIWGIRGVVLEVVRDNHNFPLCVVEADRPKSSADLIAVPLDSLRSQDITDHEYLTVRAIGAGNADARGPFSRLGWVEEAVSWIQESLGSNAKLTGDMEQHNASGTFALARFLSQNGAYWLKATGEPNRHEFSITTTLSAFCPEYLPALIAARPDWNCWVTEEAGLPLGEMRIDVLEGAVAAMATLQQKTVGRIDALFAAGAVDQRLRTLHKHMDELTAYLEEIMEQQISTKVPRIEPPRLHAIGMLVKDACLAMDQLAIPDTILHNDINPGNILTRDNTCRFIDWCEAYIGNPFVTFQHMLLLLRGGARTEQNALKSKEAYKRCWLRSLTGQQVDLAFALAPVIAIISVLYGRGQWFRSSRRYDPRLQSYARSLARHLDRETQNPSILEVLCR